jgi:HK97 family phage major capsid protein
MTSRPGFRSFGEFALCVRAASFNPKGPAAQRIRNAATTYGQESVGGDGGYAVPPDFVTEILRKVTGEGTLFGMTDRRTTKTNSLTLPVNETEPWNNSGPQAIRVAEAVAGTQYKPALGAVTVHAEKLMALVPVTEELLEDDQQLSEHLLAIVAPKFDYALNKELISGTGTAQAEGILNSAALVTVAAEGGQTPATVVYNNVVKMRRSMPQANRKRAVWMANPDLEQQLEQLVVTGTSAPALPAYLPAGVFGNADDLLLGRPVIFTEAAKAVGTPGDLMLADMSQYLTVVKTEGLRSDLSLDVWFDQAMACFRFVLRMGGKPWWSKAITPSGSVGQKSAFVALGAR